MKKLLALLLLCPSLAWGAVISATDPSLGSVLTAIAAAVDGDTVLIPAGNTTWTSQLVLSKNITLIGAGMYATSLHNGIHIVDWHGLQPLIYVTATGVWRISGIGFDGQWNAGGKGIFVANTSYGRIDHCYFYRCYDRSVQTYGLYGLIDHCVSVDGWAFSGHYGNENAAWEIYPSSPGSTNAWVVEDCYSKQTGAYTAYVGMTDGGDGARYTWRYNVCSNVGYSGFDYFFDAHGNQGSPFRSANAIRGTLFSETYNNVLYAMTANRGMYLRGGQNMHWNDQFICTGGNLGAGWPTPPAHMVTEEDGYRPGNPILTAPPGYDGHTNSYYWANKLNGGPVSALFYEQPTDPTFIRLGIEYWLTAPSTNFYRPLRYPHPRVLADNFPIVPQPFDLVSPVDGAGTTVTPTLLWNPSVNVTTGYRVEIARDYYFTDMALSATVGAGTLTYTVGAGVLVANTTYFWRVLAIGLNGSTYSGTITTADIHALVTNGVIDVAPNTPAVTYPLNGATGVPTVLTATSTPYSGARLYANSQWRVYLGSTIAWDSGTVGAITSELIGITLTNATTYGITMRQQSSNGLWSNYSPTNLFTVQAAAVPGTTVLSANLYATTEMAGSVVVTIRRTSGKDGAVGVHYATANGSASAGTDYSSTSGNVSWADQNVTDQLITIPILNSGTVSPTLRTFTFTLSSPTGGLTLGSPAAATVTILMNAPIGVSATIGNATIGKATIQ